MNDPINTTDAAAIIGIHPSLVRRYIQQKKLPARQVGRDWLIERADAEAFKPAPVGQPPGTKRKKGKAK